MKYNCKSFTLHSELLVYVEICYKRIVANSDRRYKETPIERDFAR